MPSPDPHAALILTRLYASRTDIPQELRDAATRGADRLELRLLLKDALEIYHASLGAARSAIARRIVAVLDLAPWLNDQVTYDVADSIRREAQGVRQ